MWGHLRRLLTCGERTALRRYLAALPYDDLAFPLFPRLSKGRKPRVLPEPARPAGLGAPGIRDVVNRRSMAALGRTLNPAELRKLCGANALGVKQDLGAAAEVLHLSKRTVRRKLGGELMLRRCIANAETIPEVRRMLGAPANNLLNLISSLTEDWQSALELLVRTENRAAAHSAMLLAGPADGLTNYDLDPSRDRDTVVHLQFVRARGDPVLSFRLVPDRDDRSRLRCYFWGSPGWRAGGVEAASPNLKSGRKVRPPQAGS